MKRYLQNGSLAAVTRPVVAAAVLAATAAPAMASALSGARPSLVANVVIQVTTTAPEPEKWETTVGNNGSVRVFKCKADACEDPVAVAFTFQKGSVKPPGPKELEKFAKVELPKTIRAAAAARSVMDGAVEQIETLSSSTATLKGHPAALNETKFTRGRVVARYLETGIIFASPLVIRVQAQSPNQKLAQKSLTDFIESMRIVMKERDAPGRPKAPKPQDL